MTLAILWIQLGVAAVVILGASLFLAKSADVIAIKTGLGRSFVGVVLLATATSLPELGTGISAVTVVGEPDLALGGAFGSNLFNLLIIGLMDIFWWRRFLLNHVGMSSVVIGTLGIIVISLGGIAVLMHDMSSALDGWPVSPLSIVLVVGFAVAMYFIYLFEQSKGASDKAARKGRRFRAVRVGTAPSPPCDIRVLGARRRRSGRLAVVRER